MFFAVCTALPIPALAQSKRLGGQPPVYPLAAKAAGIDGTVTVKCVISKEGNVLNPQVISGPPELQQAALDSVSTWVYQPYRHFGRAVEVDTTIHVNFSMGTGQRKLDAQAKAQAELMKSQEQTSPTPKP